jgi:hypothetical protein
MSGGAWMTGGFHAASDPQQDAQHQRGWRFA